MKKIRIIISIFLLGLALNAFSQEKNSWWQEHIDLGGYVTYSNILIFHDADDLTSNNLWHNRLNFTAYLNEHISLKAGLRNRLYYGDWLQNPFLKTGLLQDSGYLDLTHSFIDSQSLLEVSNLDRLLVDVQWKQWEFIAGRQRINWGMNTVWNPTDIFNTADFLDMDYIEKPGTDALRLAYDINGMSGIEMAYAPAKHGNTQKDKWAIKYSRSTGANDYQLQIGSYCDYFYTGGGWAGSIQNIGIKAEASYFKKNYQEYFLASMEAGYAFKNGTYWTNAVLYNGAFDENQAIVTALINRELDVLHLFPSQWAVFSQFSGNFGPAWTWSLGGVYGNQNQLFIVIPTINYSIKDNWEVNLFMQSYFADIPGIKQTNFLNFRLRYDF